MNAEFWTIRRMALLGAIIMVTYSFATNDHLACRGDRFMRSIGNLVGYAAAGAIVGAIIGRFLPAQNSH